MAAPKFTVPGLTLKDAGTIIDELQMRLHALNDLALTLKHVHWNVVGPSFIGVHTMLDPQIECVRQWADELAERIAQLGGVPNGLPGALVAARTWDDYSLDRADVMAHLGALDMVYDGVITDYRDSIEKVGDLDPVTEDLLIGHCGDLELYHWFVRAHFIGEDGVLATTGASTEKGAAKKAAPTTRARKSPAKK